MSQNQFDPKMTVTVVELTNITQGVVIPPKVLKYNTPGKAGEIQTFQPEFEQFGEPVYRVPRDYATRLLANEGGRVFRLISPNELVIQVSNGRGGTQYESIKAWKKDTLTGKWREKTADEIAKESKPETQQSIDVSRLNSGAEPAKSAKEQSKATAKKD
jgi:hypothetical protein